MKLTGKGKNTQMQNTDTIMVVYISLSFSIKVANKSIEKHHICKHILMEIQYK
jgi:uncharacterized membrane protein YcaP (DUF421 family)